MSDRLARLQPTTLWRHFAAITEIPRPSGHEQRIAAWVRGVAEEHGFGVEADARGNLFVSVPGTPGAERAPVVVLQSHLDMVCEKNRDVEHDFLRDPIRPRIDGDWVYATGTTLGADNGIGVAAALAAATDGSVSHPPLQLLFTVDEETGLTGASKLDGSLLRGDTLINLDSEEDGVLFVGCAGGADVHLRLVPRRGPAPKGVEGRRLELRGLRGGHSGLNIHENRGNALKLLARLLLSALESGIEFHLAALEGGGKHNAIPREASAELLLGRQALRRFEERQAGWLEDCRLELRGIDEGLELRLEAAPVPARVLEDADRDRLLRLIAALPHGVLAMSRDIPGLVETSSNLATVVAEDDGSYRLVTSSRSSVMPALRGVLGSIRAAGGLAGVEIETHDGYPGWKPNLDSAILQVVRRVYHDIWSREPKVTAIHAGLECGLLGEKRPGLDMVSFGPQIEGAHSPDERVQISSVERFWRALGGTLAALS